MTMNDLSKGKEASQISLVGSDYLLIRKVIVPLKKTSGIILQEETKDSVYHLEDFECHPYLAEVAVLSPELKSDKSFNVKPGDIIIVSRTLPDRIMRGMVEGIIVDGIELTRITKGDVIAVVPYLKEKVIDGKVKQSALIGTDKRSIN